MHQQENLSWFLGHNEIEHPLALQIGGSDADKIEAAITLAENYGGIFSEYNLNCGCPSPKVANKGCFGARLMLEPEKVRDIARGMIRSANGKKVTIKCRLGVDDIDSYESLHSFIATTSQSGVQHYIIHARKCLLNGLSPKDNRRIPPLQYEKVFRLVQDFPHLSFSLNGGIQNIIEASSLLSTNESEEVALGGVMIGRAAYNNPWILRNVDTAIFNEPSNPNLSRREIVANYLDYCEALQDKYGHALTTETPLGVHNSVLMRPLLTLFTGERGGKAYKRTLSSKLQSRKNNPSALRQVVESAMEEFLSSEVLDERASDEQTSDSNEAASEEPTGEEVANEELNI